MTEFNQSASTVERARAYLDDVRMGHVSFADESAPFMTLAGYLGDLLEVIDGVGDTRARRAAARRTLGKSLAAGRPVCCIDAEHPPACWLIRLQESLRELLGSPSAQLAALDVADRDTIRQAFVDAIGLRAAAAAAPCQDCVAHPALLCPSHVVELDWVSAYQELARDLALELS